MVTQVVPDSSTAPTGVPAPAAAWELFRTHGCVVYALARLLTGDEHRAADAVVELFAGLRDECPDATDDAEMRLLLLARLCRQVGLSGTERDPCLTRVLTILASTTDAEVRRALAA